MSANEHERRAARELYRSDKIRRSRRLRLDWTTRALIPAVMWWVAAQATIFAAYILIVMLGLAAVGTSAVSSVGSDDPDFTPVLVWILFTFVVGVTALISSAWMTLRAVAHFVSAVIEVADLWRPSSMDAQRAYSGAVRPPPPADPQCPRPPIHRAGMHSRRRPRRGSERCRPVCSGGRGGG